MDWTLQQQMEVSNSLPPLVDDASPVEANVLLLGGSNCERIGNAFISEPAEIKITTISLCTGGQQISSLCNKIHDQNPENINKVTVAITHVGCANFPCSPEESDHNFERYTEEVDMIRKLCPNADIIMTGITPRWGKSETISKINSQVKHFNERLDGHKELNEKFYYLDSWKFLYDSSLGSAKENLFDLEDRSALHLNEAGSKVIAEAWRAEVERLSNMHHARRLEGISEGNKTLDTRH